MDENKRNKLRLIQYRIVRACGSCANANIQSDSDFGYCVQHQYDHAKHTDNPRQLSIHRLGFCGDYRFDKRLSPEWNEFLE